MKRIEQQILHGPNIHARRSVVGSRIDPEGALPIDGDTLRERARARLPDGEEWDSVHAALQRAPGDGAAVAWPSLLGELAIVLEEDRWAHEGRFRVAPAPEPCFDLLVEAGDTEVVRGAVIIAVEIADVLAAAGAPDAGEARARLAARMQAFVRGRSAIRFNWITTLLAEAARARDVPVTKLLVDQPFIVLGHGRYRRRMEECWGDGTSAFAGRIGRDKVLTHELLRAAYVPVPAQRLVRSDEQAIAAAKEIGAPLVVKGRSSDHGVSVTTGITTERELTRALARVRALDDEVLIQKHVAGDDYRFTVVAGKIVAVARRIPPQVTGDGERSVIELVRAENERRRHVGRFARWIVPLRIDGEARAMLARVGLNPDSVPKEGQVARLRGAANLSQGGLSVDVTDEVHPDTRAAVERAARVVDLIFAGIDVLTTDITKPLKETGGVVLELNGKPGLRPHCVTPTPPRDVAGAVIEHLFPAPRRGRVPTVGVTGTNGKTTTCRMIARIFEQAGLVTGLSTTAGVTIAGRQVVQGDLAGGRTASVILQDPIVEAGVFELARGGVLKGGLWLEDVDVGIVTNVTFDHIGDDGLKRVEDLAPIKRVVAEAARIAAVLNADDEHCRGMTAGLRAPLWWVARSGDNPIVAGHVAQGGNAVVVEPCAGVDHIVHRCGERREPVIEIAAIPATLGGIAVHNVENALFAAAAGVALGLDAAIVRSALAAFENSYAVSTNRLNIHDVDGIRIVLDYVHNPDGMAKVGQTLAAMRCTGRRVFLFEAYRHRLVSEEVFPRIAAAAAPFFEHFVVTERDDARAPKPTDRPEGEAATFFAECLRRAGVADERVEVISGVLRAVDTTLAMARPGDLLLIGERARHEETWGRIQAYRFAGQPDALAAVPAG